MDRIRNENIRGTTQVAKMGDKLRESRLRRYGHIQRRDDDYVGQRVLKMELPGRRKRGRPKRRYMDTISEDMRDLGLTEEDAMDRLKWRQVIRCGDPT